ncbi:MAG: hypothetical protein IAE91_10140 [Ignavibacteriaceae bacterium]|nr:hypothetical protein [Ignavibacteriaceae bacterium]
MDFQANQLRAKLDETVLKAVSEVRKEIYDNTIIPVVLNWFENDSSLNDLNAKIISEVNGRWNFINSKLNVIFSEFLAYSGETFKVSNKTGTADFDTKKILTSISENITLALGAAGTSIIAMIAGGSGTALIATGPIGLIIGAAIGIYAFIKGKEKLNDEVKKFIVDKNLPPLVKKLGKNKVMTELYASTNAFDNEVYKILTETLRPVYSIIDKKILDSNGD